MTLSLNSIESGRAIRTPRILIYGTEGIGKSTFAAGAAEPIFIQTEDGLDGIGCDRFPLAKSFDDVVEALKIIRDEESKYKTVVIDSVDWFEKLICKKLCRDHGNVQTVEQIEKGFCRYRKHLLNVWSEVLSILSTIRDNGKTIVLIAHSCTRRIEDPDDVAYDKFAPNLDPVSANLLSEWSDIIGFAYQQKVVAKTEDHFGERRAILQPVGANGGNRRLRIVGSVFCVAKNRYGIIGDANNTIELSWEALRNEMVKAIEN